MLSSPPASAVFPSPESATVVPNAASPLASSEAVIRDPVGDQAEPDRENIHAAPRDPSLGAPTSALSPSRESATLLPNSPPAVLSSTGRVSLGPCCVQVDPDLVNTHAEPVWPSL